MNVIQNELKKQKKNEKHMKNKLKKDNGFLCF